MPTTLEQWYEWAFKLNWQYHQEQVESKLLHPHSTHAGSKFGKLLGGSSKKGKASIITEMKAQPLATAVTLPNQSNISQHASDAMDVDHAGRCPLIRCFNCGKLGHTARNCREKREIREVMTEEQNFPKQSQ
jgi:Zinc knuckle